MTVTARFDGGPWDGQRRPYPGDPPGVIEVPVEKGGPFKYVLVNKKRSWQPGGDLAIYAPHPEEEPA